MRFKVAVFLSLLSTLFFFCTCKQLLRFGGEGPPQAHVFIHEVLNWRPCLGIMGPLGVWSLASRRNPCSYTLSVILNSAAWSTELGSGSCQLLPPRPPPKPQNFCSLRMLRVMTYYLGSAHYRVVGTGEAPRVPFIKHKLYISAPDSYPS